MAPEIHSPASASGPRTSGGWAPPADRGAGPSVHAVPGLPAALRAAASGNQLEATLHDVVQEAARHVDARYGALGVLSPDGRRLDRIVVTGMDDDDRDRIGRMPEGHGILGLLVTDPTVLRLDDVSQHPAAQGFPPGHPTMRSFLGVPIRVGDVVFGNLYLTEKRTGGRFTAADAEVAQALAAVAGLAIGSARLAEQAETRRRWAQAATEMATALMSGADPDEILRAATTRVSQLADADIAGVLVPVEKFAATLRIVAAVGHAAQDVEGVRVPLTGCDCEALRVAGSARIFEDISTVPIVGDRDGVPVHLTAGYGPALVAPLGNGPHRGVLVALRAAGGPPFCPEQLDLLGAFTAQASVALELAHAQHRARRLHVQADRERIARDLHDHVVQRIFATALSLDRLGQSLENDRDEVAAALSQRVEDLHGTIERIRTSIFELHQAQDAPAAGFRRHVADVLRSVTEGRGLRLNLRIHTEHDELPPDLALDLVAVVGELVTNVVRHARAQRVTVSVEVAEVASVVVIDDGRGLPAVHVRSGLANLADRAERRGGSLITASSTSGTEIRWTAAVPG